MAKRNSAKKAKQSQAERGRVVAKIEDLYSIELGNPPSLFWYLDFNYQLPRSIVVHHDWEEIRQVEIPSASQWADKIVTRFDCISRDSIIRELTKWIANNIGSV
jgi:hypothetical protein